MFSAGYMNNEYVYTMYILEGKTKMFYKITLKLI